MGCGDRARQRHRPAPARLAVLFSTTPRQILAYRDPVDMRKQFDGLVALTKSALCEDPLSGSLFVFFNRRRNIVKAVYWDRTGYCLFAKRLERGRFALPGTDRKRELSEQAFRLILDGIELGRRRRMR